MPPRRLVREKRSRAAASPIEGAPGEKAGRIALTADWDVEPREGHRETRHRTALAADGGALAVPCDAHFVATPAGVALLVEPAVVATAIEGGRKTRSVRRSAGGVFRSSL